MSFLTKVPEGILILYSRLASIILKLKPFIRKEWQGSGIFFIALFLFFLKLLFVSGNEILAEQYDPATYAAQSVGGAYMAFPPAYPWWLKFSAALGVPQRIAIEVLFVLSSTVVFFQTKKIAGSVVAASALLVIVFGPLSIFLFDHLISESLYLCLMLVALAISFFCIRVSDSIPRFIGFSFLGVALGFAALTRNESQLLLVWIFALGGVCLLVDRCAGDIFFRVKNIIKIAPYVFVSVFGMYLVVFGNSAANYLSEGVFATSLPQLPSHLSLLKRLSEIDDGTPDVRFVPISKKARALAYAASPTLRELSASVESLNNPFQVASKNIGLPDGEIGAGWIWHAFNAALGESGRGKANTINDFYVKANEEIDAAFKNGTLVRRGRLVPLLSFGVDPINTLFSSFVTVMKGSVSYIGYAKDPGYQIKLYDKVALRRSANYEGSGDSVVHGWVAAKGRAVDSIIVFFKNSDGKTLRVLADHFERPDVTQGLLNEKREDPRVVGFRASSGNGGYKPNSISYRFESGNSLDANEVIGGRAALLSTPGNPEYVIHGIDGLNDTATPERSGIRHKFQLYVLNLFGGAGWGIVSLVFVFSGFVFSCAYIFGKTKTDIYLFPFAYFFVFILYFSRVVFYSLIEAGGWSIQLRYMLPAGLLVFVMFFSSLWFIFKYLSNFYMIGVGRVRN